MSKRIRTNSIKRGVIVFVLYVVAWSYCGLAQDPFAPEPPFQWQQSTIRSWVVYTAPNRIPMKSSRAHGIARAAFKPLLLEALKSDTEFRDMFRNHASSDTGQAVGISKLQEMLRDRNSQIDIQYFAHDAATNMIVACLVLLPKVDVKPGERALSYPVVALRQGEESWGYLIPGSAIRKDLFPMLHAAQRSASAVDVHSFWKKEKDWQEKTTYPAPPPGSKLTFDLPPGSMLADDFFKEGTQVSFASIQTAADRKLRERKAKLADLRESASQLRRKGVESSVRGAEVDLAIARSLDDAIFRGRQAKKTEYTLKDITFDGVWLAYRNAITNDMTGIPLANHDASAIERTTPLGTLTRYLFALRQGNHEAFVSAIEPGSRWRDRIEKSHGLAELRKERTSGWVSVTSVFEMSFVVKGTNYSAIYYRITPTDAPVERGTGLLDFLFFKQESDGKWFITEDVYNTSLKKAFDRALPSAQEKTSVELYKLIEGFSSDSQVFRQMIKPRLLAMD